MKICIACSSGGHLTEAMELLPIIKKHDVFFFTLEVEHIKKSLKKYRLYLSDDPKRNPVKFFRLFLNSMLVLIKEKPDLVISTGAGVTLPLSILSKILFGSKIIYIECSAQVFRPSLTGRIIYWFSDLFFVQWKSLLKFFGKKAIYGGLIILS